MNIIYSFVPYFLLFDYSSFLYRRKHGNSIDW